MIGVRNSGILGIGLLTSCSDDDEKNVTLLDDDFDNNAGRQYVSTVNQEGALDAVDVRHWILDILTNLVALAVTVVPNAVV
jgi:hypothetical protein